MFRPSSPTSLLLSASFTLWHVTMPSSAHCFMTTMASSENLSSISHLLLSDLGFSLLNQPRVRGSSPGKINSSFIAHLSSLPRQVTERILDFSDQWHLIHCLGLTKIHFRLGGDFGYGFLQIPHWPSSLCSLIKLMYEYIPVNSLVSSGTLAFTYIFPPFRAMTGLSPVSY